MAQKSTTPQTDLARVPEGFRRLGSVTAECWFALKEGNVVRGKLLGVYSRKDPRNKVTGTSEFFQVELSESCECRYGKGEKVTFKHAPVGTIINLNCNTKTEVLKDLMPDITRGAEFEIYVHCGKKLDLANGNTMWNMTPGSKMTKAPKAVDSPDFGTDGDGDDAGTQDAA